MRKLLKNQDGLVLVDAILGLLVLTIALLAVAGTMGSAAKSTVAIPKYTVVANLAQTRVEELKNASITDWQAFIDTTPESVTKYNPDDNTDQYTVAATKPILKEIDKQKVVAEVQVTVSWVDNKVNRSQKYVAYYSKPD